MEMGLEYLFVEFCALVCAVTLSFRLGKIVRKRWGKRAGDEGSSERQVEWYCFFSPHTFHRHRKAKGRAAKSVKENSCPSKRVRLLAR